ncbi:MAG TPA: hypothetical protein VGJ48_21075 [Pyrinomonadaceae bacterium]|jgi:hypothetical protein
MTERAFKQVMRCVNILAISGLGFALLISVSAQETKQNQKPVIIQTDTAREDGSRAFTEMEEELRAKRAIKSVEKEYQENLDRARDLSLLGASIVASFKQKNELNREDARKLEKVEKLAKGIRRAAGGSEDDVEMENPPRDLASALDMLGDVSKSLKEKVEKTPKHVISAAVIDEANVLLELVRIVRSLPPKV